MNKLQTFFISLRVFMAFISWGYFVPDESWQSVEVAHRLVFGNGYLTWEWQHGLRSYLHPALFVPVFQCLKMFQLDSPFLIILCPKLLQAIISGIGDIAIVNVFEKLVSKEKKTTFVWIYASNWFLLYASSRTLINTFEMCLTNVALMLFVQKRSTYVSLIAFSFMLRPTTAIFWLPMVLYDLIARTSIKDFFIGMLPQAIFIPILALSIDSYLYGQLTIIPWNFLHFNILHNISEQYGVHPWHWYLSNFMPALTLGIGLLPLFKGMKVAFQGRKEPSKMLVISLVWSLVIYSLLGHKEHRFLLPLIPIMLALMTEGVKRNDLVLKVFCVCNVFLALYLSIFHQAAPHDAMNYLSSHRDSKGVLFLTPCHGTPFYSHIHWNIPMRFLECPPDLGDNPMDHDQLFRKDPVKWMKTEVELSEFDHIVMYEKWQKMIEPVLITKGLKLCEKLWHTHFPEGSTSNYMLIYCHMK